MRLTNPAASTAANITTTMVVFMMFFRKREASHKIVLNILRQSGNAEVPIVPVQRALDVYSLYGLARVRKPVRASPP